MHEFLDWIPVALAVLFAVGIAATMDKTPTEDQEAVRTAFISVPAFVFLLALVFYLLQQIMQLISNLIGSVL